MTPDRLRRTALAVALLAAGMTNAAPVASAAGLPHASVAHHFVWPDAPYDGSGRVLTQRVPQAHSRMDYDPFSSLHFE